MSYIRDLGAFSKEQEKALLDISPQDLRKLPIDRKVDLAFMHFDAKAREREAFWQSVEGIATGMIPILVAFGILKAGNR